MRGLLVLLVAAAAAWAPPAPGRCHVAGCSRRHATLVLQAFADDDDGKDDGQGSPEGEDVSAEERSEVDDFRARLMSQFSGGGDDPPSADSPVDQLLKGAGLSVAPPATKASELAAGRMLVANPERFCSRNPFSRPVKDLGRFGLQGPIDLGALDPDFAAQMLPVLYLIEHGSGGSRALLMERRTGALMGDVSMEQYGCVAISPLWLGGTSKQNSLYVVHDVDSLASANEVNGGGLFLGGWSDARPRVADSSLAEGRFKFFLGATEWDAGQLEDEFKAGAWLALDCEPSLVLKDRVSGWRPGRPRPVWTELIKLLGSDDEKLLRQVYPDEGSEDE